MGAIGGTLEGGQSVVVAAEPVVEDRGSPVVGGEPEPFAAAEHFLPVGLGQAWASAS